MPDKRLLLVEDEPGLQLALTDRLTAEGYAVETAGDGHTAVARATGEPFDVIVLAGAIDEVPAAILQQLKQGGRLLAITGQEPVQVARIHGADQSARPVFDTVVAPLPGFKKKSGFSF